jgi:ribosomal protein S27AE
MSTSRRRRATIAGARATFWGADAVVINVSPTGVLVRAAQHRPAGSDGPLILEIDGLPLELTVRVVRCEPIAGPLTAATGGFALALAFLNVSPEVQARLDAACGTPRGEFESRRLKVSLSRRCPKCLSRNVVKKGRRSYSCGQCGQMFTGFRLGFLRFAR